MLTVSGENMKNFSCDARFSDSDRSFPPKGDILFSTDSKHVIAFPFRVTVGRLDY